MKKLVKILLTLVASTVLLSGIALSFENGETDNNEMRGRHHGPPPEAYEACESKSAGDAAQFVSPRGETRTGTCEQEGDRLVLRPDDNPKRNGGGRHQGPPPEAYTACDGKSAGAVSQFVSPRGETVTGTCEQEGDQMVLRPDRR